MINKSENNDLKILIDALKYTSNIIVDLTNKLNEQENKINKIENSINTLKKEYIELNSKISFNQNNNSNNFNSTLFTEKLIKNERNIENDTECDQIATYLLSKNNDSDDYNKINNKLKDSIFKDKNKINKLINSIVKKKNSLNDIIENNKEKSLLTEYNLNEIDYEQKYNFYEEKDKNIQGSNANVNTITNANTNANTNTNTIINTNTNANTNTNTNANLNINENTNENLKNIRRKSNFARRF
jgi:HD-GYP domain-containing protein (c-di-GMP phosphodiesterase class II)